MRRRAGVLGEKDGELPVISETGAGNNIGEWTNEITEPFHSAKTTSSRVTDFRTRPSFLPDNIFYLEKDKRYQNR